MANYNPGPASAVTPQTFAPMMNVSIGGVFPLTLTPAAVAANTTGTLTVGSTGLGLQINDFIRVSLQGDQTAGIFVADAWVSSYDTLKVTYGNVGTTSATPVNGVYDIFVMRPDTSISQTNPAIQP